MASKRGFLKMFEVVSALEKKTSQITILVRMNVHPQEYKQVK
jgi:hypothetical protein